MHLYLTQTLPMVAHPRTGASVPRGGVVVLALHDGWYVLDSAVPLPNATLLASGPNRYADALALPQAQQYIDRYMEAVWEAVATMPDGTTQTIRRRSKRAARPVNAPAVADMLVPHRWAGE
jgi:hypothetical protein